MNIDKITGEDRLKIMIDVANQYYNLGKNQSEIAEAYDTNRFKISKLLQDARSEHVVEIKIRSSYEASLNIEQDLLNAFPLDKALVYNAQFSPYIESLEQIGEMGADYLNLLLQDGIVLGVTWGKTIYSVVSHIPALTEKKLSVVQLAGNFKMQNPSIESRALVPKIAAAYSGTYYFLDVPLYVKDTALRAALIFEPGIQETLSMSRAMDVVLTGIGGISSLPVSNPVFAPYVTPQDLREENNCLGSIYGYILAEDGQIADIPLNDKVIAAPLENILTAKHRLAVVYGRHKAKVSAVAIKQGYVNEILTDTDTARTILRYA